MSGRSGYRKSHHPLLGRFGVTRGPRRAAHEMPLWTLTFTLPGMLGLGLEPQLIGVTVEPNTGHVTIKGARAAWITDQAFNVLKRVAPYGLPGAGRINVCWTRAIDPDHPNRPSRTTVDTLIWTGATRGVMSGTSWRAYEPSHVAGLVR